MSVIKIKACTVYELCEKLKSYSSDKIKLQPGKIYSHVYFLEQKRMLAKSDDPCSSQKGRVNYCITPIGEIHLNRLINQYYLTVNTTNTTIYKIENSAQGFNP